jgi:peptidoglycan/LPS O-acetylase OafA/YrhL
MMGYFVTSLAKLESVSTIGSVMDDIIAFVAASFCSSASFLCLIASSSSSELISSRSLVEIGYISYERYLIIRLTPFLGADKVIHFGRE